MDPTTLQIAPRVAAVGLLGAALAAPMAWVSSWRRGYLPGLVAPMAVVSLPSALAAGSSMPRQRCGWAWAVPQFGSARSLSCTPYFAKNEARAWNAETSPASPKACTFDTKREALAWYGRERAALPSRVDPRDGGMGRRLLPVLLDEREHSVSAKTYVADAALLRFTPIAPGAVRIAEATDREVSRGSAPIRAPRDSAGSRSQGRSSHRSIAVPKWSDEDQIEWAAKCYPIRQDAAHRA
jgi:hypothetical protein